MFKPNREFQAGLNADDSRRRRQNNSLSLRKQDREKKLQKKRQRILERSSPNSGREDSVSLLSNGNTNQSSSSSHQAPTERVPTIQQLPKLVEGVYHTSIAAQFECVKGIRILLSQPDKPPIKQVIDVGVVPRLIQLSRDCEHAALQYESLWALLNIASGPAECTAHIIRNNSHNVFIDLLRSSRYYEIREQSMWALGNISGDGKELKDLLLRNGILGNMLFICQSGFDAQCVTNFNNVPYVTRAPLLQFLSLLGTASWTLSNLCRASPPPTLQHLELIIQCLMCLMKQALHYKSVLEEKNVAQLPGDLRGVLEHEAQRFANSVDEILGNIAWAASYLTGFEFDEEKLGYDGMQHLITRMGQDGLIEQFVSLMDYGNANVRHSCNRVIGNILTGSDENTKKCLNLGILQKYYNVLALYHCSSDGNGNNREKKEICWALSNITAGPIEDKLLVLQHKLYPMLIGYLQSAPYEVGKEALWALSNATTDQDKRIIAPLIELGIIKAICCFLQQRTTAQNAHSRLNHKIVMVALECIENILAVGHQHLALGEPNQFAAAFEEEGCIDFLEELQADEQTADDIYEKCVELIKKYFDGEQNDNDDGNGNEHEQQQADLENADEENNHNLDYGLANNSNQNNSNSGQFGFGLQANHTGTFGF
eukprot:CAMPEP_0197034330 /NCGR_PEP_ID=MMETSP1384-20130603/12477_1 /TAXON_ID=29189 /ORGANISM="Ammonia sp." /LENGTH=654 /DNA_ID=CAMNT_0042464245 /DNA_START=99 /DNA_END=2063 /DNA_ORIENTATION=-